MSIYRRGADFERTLVTQFWSHGWAAVRAAGSGTRKEPVPDIIAVKDGRVIVIECKTTKKDRLSLTAAIKQLNDFVTLSGGKGYMAVRFYRKRARFYPIDDLISRKNKTIHENDPYQSLDTVVGEQKRLQ